MFCGSNLPNPNILVLICFAVQIFHDALTTGVHKCYLKPDTRKSLCCKKHSINNCDEDKDNGGPGHSGDDDCGNDFGNGFK